MTDATPTDRPVKDRARHTAAVLCLVAGVVHLLGGRFLVMIFGVGYVIAAIALFRDWRRARGLAITCAALRGVGTLFLLALKVPDVLAGNSTPEARLEVGRDLYWLVVNAAIIALMIGSGLRQSRDRARMM